MVIANMACRVWKQIAATLTWAACPTGARKMIPSLRSWIRNMQAAHSLERCTMGSCSFQQLTISFRNLKRKSLRKRISRWRGKWRWTSQKSQEKRLKKDWMRIKEWSRSVSQITHLSTSRSRHQCNTSLCSVSKASTQVTVQTQQQRWLLHRKAIVAIKRKESLGGCRRNKNGRISHSSTCRLIKRLWVASCSSHCLARYITYRSNRLMQCRSQRQRRRMKWHLSVSDIWRRRRLKVTWTLVTNNLWSPWTRRQA